MNERGPVYRYGRKARTGEVGMFLRPVMVYAYYDAEGACLYVGQTTSPDARHHHHRAKSPWISRAGEMQVLALYLKRGDALIAEARAIRELAPLHNIRHARKAAA